MTKQSAAAVTTSTRGPSSVLCAAPVARWAWGSYLRALMAPADRLHGVLVIDKPIGPTSHDVVARLRRVLGTRAIGHAGTLDPAASGVLVVAVGEATKLCSYLTAESKRYQATVTFGTATTTLDAEGDVVATAPIPDALANELRFLT
jgi:tRNA U55 pseudouridine synthase TruB